jgi:hypothetical protein
MSSTPFRNQLERPITQLIAWRDGAIEHLRWRAFALSRFAGMDEVERTPTLRQIQRPIAQLMSLRDSALEFERAHAAELGKVEPSHRNSARNLLHYLSIRQHDIRELQQDLGALGLSSLGVLEPHALASLDSVMTILERLSDRHLLSAAHPPVDLRSGPLLLRDHTRSLLGPEPPGRFVRIMVTMSSEAARDAQLVQDLLIAGMDVMRINCAHDDPDAWHAMAECAMLNKGPNIVETVRFLGGILSRMDEHYVKRRPTLRKLSVAQLRAA